MAVYPNSIFPWTNRINNVNIVWAADPNSLADEIQAIETAVGTVPYVEPSPPVGNQITYSTLSARVSDAMDNSQLPYAWLSNQNGFFISAGAQIYNSYQAVNDPYGIWNGTDGTIPCNGWWTISLEQKWNQHGNSFRGGNVQFLQLNGTIIESDIWNWDTFFGVPNEGYFTSVLGAQGYTHIFWQGELHKGDRLQSLSVNNTFCPGIQVTGCNLKLYCNRTLTGNFQSG